MDKPTVKIIGEDGNGALIIGRAYRALCKNGQEAQAAEFLDRATSAASYYKMLEIVAEYVYIK